MDIKELQQIQGAPEDHWYYAAKFDLLASIVSGFGAKRIADVGAGSGVFSRLLLRHTGCQEALCVDPAYETEYDERVGDKLLKFRRSYDGRDFDLILLMDVLEHVDDDAGLLRHVAAAVAPGTPIFITVPAFGFLWSAHDVFLEHRRRYTAASMRACIGAAGLRTEWARYFYAAIFPLVAVIRLLSRGRAPEKGSDLRPAPAPVAWLLRAALKLERQALFRVNRLAGLSVVALART
jgi:SAM-dependent methyltransferase